MEYLGQKASILPKIQASGTGTYNLYSFDAIVDLAIADQLMKWGINSRGLRERLDSIRKLIPKLYDPTEGVNSLKPEDHWFFIETKAGIQHDPYHVMPYCDVMDGNFSKLVIGSRGILIINLTALKSVALGQPNGLAKLEDGEDNLPNADGHRKIRV